GQSVVTSVLNSQVDLPREFDIFNDGFHSDSTVTGGGTYQCYQRLFDRNETSSKGTIRLDAGRSTSFRRVEPRRRPAYRPTSASQAHESKRKARQVAQTSTTLP